MKGTLRHRDLEELLTPPEAPEPPAGLAERIKAEIPEPLRLAEAAEPAPGERRRWRRLPVLAAAASVAVALLGGALSLRLMERAAPLESFAEKRAEPRRESEREGAAAPLAPEPAPVPPATAGRLDFRGGAPRPGSQTRLESARQAPAEADAAADAAGAAGRFRAGADPVLGEDSQALRRAAGLRDQAVAVPEGIPAGAEAQAGGRAAARTRDEARDQDKLRALGYVSGVAGGVSGGVAGGVPGGTVGGVPGGVAGGSPAPPPAAKAAPESASSRRVDDLEVGDMAAIGEPAARFGFEAHEEMEAAAAPSTGGSEEPNDQPYGDVFFRDYGVNPFLDAEEDRLSTFALEVDTGSYTVLRRYLRDGTLPPPDAVRIEELVNYFHYGDAPPRRSEGDFALRAEGAPSPFAPGERYRVLRLAVRGREVAAADRKPAVLTFVVDVSGSMDRENRLGLVKQALALLLSELTRDDRVGLVVYGSAGRVLLEPTPNLGAIRSALERLAAEGSTNAEEGLRLGYEVAGRHFRPGAINRIVLCSDGVANVGATGPKSILATIEAEARRGIELTTVGFGMGNYNDVLMEQLADRGDGRYAYVDDLGEARRIFVEELTGTLETIASDAKVQVEFNPEVVSRWRLLGYENRDVADERFRDDTVDAGEIGAGHTATALYEVKLQDDPAAGAVAATLRLRYRSKASGEPVEQERELPLAAFAGSWEEAPPALRLAALVAELGEILRGSYWAREGSLEEVFRLAQVVALDFPGDPRVAELASLAGRAAELARAERQRSPGGDGE